MFVFATMFFLILTFHWQAEVFTKVQVLSKVPRTWPLHSRLLTWRFQRTNHAILEYETRAGWYMRSHERVGAFGGGRLELQY